jgi:hypothetical protein
MVHAESDSFIINVYAPTNIVLSYSYADNISRSEVFSANKSVWRIDLTPISMTFHTDAVDVYYFSLLLYYRIQTNQTIIIDVYSGSAQTMSESKIDVNANAAEFDFKIITSLEPHFPTVEDYANIVLERLPTKQDFFDFLAFQMQQNAMMNSNLEIMWVVVCINAGLSILAIFVVTFRREKEKVRSV